MGISKELGKQKRGSSWAGISQRPPCHPDHGLRPAI